MFKHHPRANAWHLGHGASGLLEIYYGREDKKLQNRTCHVQQSIEAIHPGNFVRTAQNGKLGASFAVRARREAQWIVVRIHRVL